MKANKLIILSIFALLAASLTLGCTGSSSTDNPTPVPTASSVVTDNNQTVAPTDTPLPVDTGTPTTITNGSDDQAGLNASQGTYSGGALPFPNNTSTLGGSS